MESNISVNVRNFTPSKITFVQGITKNNRIPPINMKYGEEEKSKRFFQLVLPQSSLRLLSRPDDKTGELSYTLSYSLTGCDNYGRDRADESVDIGKLYNSLLDLDELVIKTAVENSVKWFGKKRSEEGIRESYKKTVRISNDKISGEAVPNGKYAPSWWIKIPVYDGKVGIDDEGIIDNRGHPYKDVTPGNLANIFTNNCQAKIAVTGNVYVMSGGGFGITWKLRAAQVLPSSRVKAADLFGTTTDEQESTEENQPSQTEGTQVELETEPEPAPAPAPSRKKRSAVNQ